MKKIFIFIFIATAWLPGIAQTAYWQQEVHYTIDVSLNDHEHTLNGFLKLRYINHSPDTLTFIWFHIWPNAFKNDKTAFTEQTLQNGRTDFYFSNREQRGYINRLDFRVGNNTLKTEDHPQHIDIVKVYLPAPLAPAQETVLTTPFHVKIPANFSRGGHTGHSYQITQWYPKPAVYDRTGWHPMPYLDQGEFYSEFGSFDVRITVPDYYAVAATGELQNEQEIQWLKSRSGFGNVEEGNRKYEVRSKKPAAQKSSPYSKKQPQTQRNQKPKTKNYKPQTKILRYTQNNIHDFAWFADSAYIVQHDTIQLPSGRVVQAWSFYRSQKSKAWNNSIQYIKDAIHFRSNLIGEYPYNVVTVVEAKMGFPGGMEYPTITSISPALNEKQLDLTIEHEIGHNWFYGILASNERDHPWMDEGINTYYDNRYKALKYTTPDYPAWIQKRLPDNPEVLAVDAIAKIKKDQPVTCSSSAFTFLNYLTMVYLKTAILLQHLEATLGTQRFDSCMQAYYRQWQFKHPYPNDFQQIMQAGAGKDLQPFFDSLQQKGMVTREVRMKKLRPAFIFSFRDYDRVNYINWMPALGYNMYDRFMLGLAFHNYTFPLHKLQFFIAPMYGTGSKQINGIGRIGYTWRPMGKWEKIDLSVSGLRYSIQDGIDSNGNKVVANFYKIAPALRVTFNNKDPRSTIHKWLEWRTFLIGEKGFHYFLKSDGEYYPAEAKVKHRYLNQLTFNAGDYRALYPYDVQLQLQQGDGFYRASATGHYFFNYAREGGLQMRVFAAKFGYIGEKTLSKQLRTEVYHPKLTAVRGIEDYTYSDYFLGRNEMQSGLASQQIMIRDGGLKLRTDLFQGLQGRSDNWIASMNLNTTLPKGMFPIPVPLRIFLDVGTYAEAWKKESATSRFLYVAGLQLSLAKNLVNIYAPVLYSKEFRDNLKTVPDENTFFKKISFSIDIHRFNLRKSTGNKIPF